MIVTFLAQTHDVDMCLFCNALIQKAWKVGRAVYCTGLETSKGEKTTGLSIINDSTAARMTQRAAQIWHRNTVTERRFMNTQHQLGFAKGDTVYNIHGQQGAYIASYGGKHIVAPEYEDHYGEPSWDRPEEWDQIFEQPPTMKLEAKIDELDKQITEKRTELQAINDELRQAENKRKESLQKLKQHQALHHIENYIDGKFTHFLEVPNYSAPTIVTADSALEKGGTEYENRWNKTLKLLTLFGDTKGDLQWRINRYSDGSGNNNTDVYPVESEGEAIAIVRRLYAEAVEEWRQQEKKHYGRALSWARECPADWIEVPDDVREYLRQAQLEQRQNAIAKARKELEKAEAALMELTGDTDVNQESVR